MAQTAEEPDGFLADARFRAALDAMADVFIVCTAERNGDGLISEFRYNFLNKAGLNLFGRTESEMVGHGLLELYPSHTELGLFDVYRDVVETGTPAVFEIPWFDEQGLQGSFQVTASKYLDGYILTGRDISERQAAQQRLVASEERFRRSFDQAQVPMAMVGIEKDSDEPGPVIRVNQAMVEFLGIQRRILMSGRLPDCSCSDDPEGLLAQFRLALKTPGLHPAAERSFTGADGVRRWALVTVTAMDTGGGPAHTAGPAPTAADADPVAVLIQMQDITGRKEMEAKLRHNSLHDALTGLPNRALLTDRTEQDLLRAHRSGRPLAIMFLDLDNFKAINDSFGHAAGDAFLIEVSRRLQSAIRESDSLARVGGDEFVVLCPEVGTEAEAVAVARGLLEHLEADIRLDGEIVAAAASIGIALSTAHSSFRDPDASGRPGDVLGQALRGSRLEHRRPVSAPGVSLRGARSGCAASRPAGSGPTPLDRSTPPRR